MPTAFLPFIQPCDQGATGHQGVDGDADAAHAADPLAMPILIERMSS